MFSSNVITKGKESVFYNNAPSQYIIIYHVLRKSYHLDKMNIFPII